MLFAFTGVISCLKKHGRRNAQGRSQKKNQKIIEKQKANEEPMGKHQTTT
jgi:hypothetical protein